MHHAGPVLVYTSTLRGYSNAKQQGQLLKVFAEIQVRCVPINTITYRASGAPGCSARDRV